MKAIGKVDVLMVPIGGIYTINGEQAKAVMKQLKPRLFVLPMHYGVPGYDDLAGPGRVPRRAEERQEDADTNELVFPIDTKPEAPTVVMLGWKSEGEEGEGAGEEVGSSPRLYPEGAVCAKKPRVAN